MSRLIHHKSKFHFTGCRYWMIALFEWDVRLESNAACKIHVFLTYYTTQLSSWILVLITLDCFISVSFPLKVVCYFFYHGGIIIIIKNRYHKNITFTWQHW